MGPVSWASIAEGVISVGIKAGAGAFDGRTTWIGGAKAVL